MNIDKSGDEIKVETDMKTVRYLKKNWCEEEPLLSEDGVVYLEAWKKNLIERFGVDLDELQN